MIIMLALASAGRAAATVTAPVTAAVMAVAFRPGGIVSDQPCALRAMIIMLTWACADLSTERDTPVQSACEHRRPDSPFAFLSPAINKTRGLTQSRALHSEFRGSTSGTELP
jgi:hypothetical protein